MSNKIEKNIKFCLKILIGLLVLIYYNMAKLWIGVISDDLSIHFDTYIVVMNATIPFILLFINLGVIGVLVIKSNYKYRKQLLLMHGLFSLVMLFNFIALVIMQDEFSAFTESFSSQQIDTAFLVYTHAAWFILIVACLSVLCSVIYTVISLYLILNTKTSEQPARLLTKKDKLLVTAVYFCYVLMLLISLSSKDIYLNQPVTIEIKEEDKIPLGVCGINGYGYICGEDGKELSDIFYENDLIRPLFRYDFNPKLKQYKKYLIYQRVQYHIKDKTNGSLKNGDIVEIEMKLDKSSKNIQITGATTYKIKVSGLPQQDVLTYNELSAEQIASIDNSVQTYINKLFNNKQLVLGYDDVYTNLHNYEQVTLIEKGYYSTFLLRDSKANAMFSYDYYYLGYIRDSKFNSIETIQYVYKISGETLNLKDYYVEVYYDISWDVLNPSECKDSKIRYYAYDEMEREELKNRSNIIWLKEDH